MTTKSQLLDYQYRGVQLDNFNALDFLVQTYEETWQSVDTLSTPELNCTGRPCHLQVDYIDPHPDKLSKTRVLRASGNNTLPNFIGQWFPRADDEDTADLHATMMLVLLKPWRHIEDLRNENRTWSNELQFFLDNSDARYRDIVCSIQDYHRCKTAAEDVVDDCEHPSLATSMQEIPDDDSNENEEDCGTMNPATTIGEDQITEEDIIRAEEDNVSAREKTYASQAVHVGAMSAIFDVGNANDRFSESAAIQVADAQHLEQLQVWQEAMQRNISLSPSQILLSSQGDEGNVTSLISSTMSHPPIEDSSTVELQVLSDHTLSPATQTDLLADQSRALDLITRHLQETLHGSLPTPLLMQIQGEGGTGKSKLIQTVTRLFEDLAVAHWLVKCAYTGIAASIISGETAHRAAGLSVNGQRPSVSARERMQKKWQDVRYLIIDEISMISRKTLAEMSTNITCAKLGDMVCPMCFRIEYNLISQALAANVGCRLCFRRHQCDNLWRFSPISARYGWRACSIILPSIITRFRRMECGPEDIRTISDSRHSHRTGSSN